MEVYVLTRNQFHKFVDDFHQNETV